MKILYQFPYEDIKQGEKVILYGGGNVCKSFLEQIEVNDYCKVIAITDRDFENIKINFKLDLPIIAPNEIAKYGYDKIIISVVNGKEEIAKFLENVGVKASKIVSKNFAKFDIVSDTAEYNVIRTVFDVLQIENPSYIDAGACHPHLSSNTMPFYQKGSRGVNIEANVLLKSEFEKYRPEDINLFVGLAKEQGEMILYRANNPFLNTLSKDATKWHIEHHNAKYLSKEVIKVTTLNDIVNEYCNGQFLDFLDIDIEGLDEEVLRSVDFSNSSPLLINTEGYMPTFNKFMINKKCEGDGYMPYCRVGCNAVYLRKDIYKRVLSL